MVKNASLIQLVAHAHEAACREGYGGPAACDRAAAVLAAADPSLTTGMARVTVAELRSAPQETLP